MIDPVNPNPAVPAAPTAPTADAPVGTPATGPGPTPVPATPATPTPAPVTPSTPSTPPAAEPATPASTPATPPAPAQPAAPTTVVQTQQIGKYQVRVLNDKCIGAASCVAISPAVFKLNEHNIAEVISESDTDDNKLLAAQSCPTSAIEVIDTSTGEVVWPK